MSESLTKLGKRIRHLRTNLKLSQEKLATLSGISAKYMSDMERGAANVCIHILERVAANLGVTVIDLLENEHEAEREILVKEMACMMEKADNEQIRVMYRVLKAMR